MHVKYPTAIWRPQQLNPKLWRKLVTLSRRKVTDLYFIQGTFPRQRTSRTPEAASLIASVCPTQMASLCPTVKDALDSKTKMKCEGLCQKLRERIHWKSNGLLEWSLPFHVTRQIFSKTYPLAVAKKTGLVKQRQPWQEAKQGLAYWLTERTGTGHVFPDLITALHKLCLYLQH